MALVRILVDGQGLLNSANPPSDPHSHRFEAALDEMLHRLTSYQDATGTPLSVVFEAGTGNFDPSAATAFQELDVQLGRPGQRTSQLLMRLAHKWGSHGDLLVVSNDWTNGAALPSIGGNVCSCAEFLQLVNKCLEDLKQQIVKHNQREDQKFTDHG